MLAIAQIRRHYEALKQPLSLMPWNWTSPLWPDFRYDAAVMAPLEQRFLLASGEVLGAVRHVAADERESLRIDLLSDEAVRTSAIEGEMLDRRSVQSSLRRQFGLSATEPHARPRERGVAAMMVDVYSGWAARLDHPTLFRWHRFLLAHDAGLEVVGAYRRHGDAMQIVSGRSDRPVVHFEAPPSDRVPAEMERFIGWFNDGAPGGPAALPALTRAGLGHLWFESIHPFEDGNGRLGRALAEKSLAQSIGQPSLIALAHQIERHRGAYYDRLGRHQRIMDATGWLVHFAETILAAQQTTLSRVAFLIAKARFHDRLRDRLNPRQHKALSRMLREGPEGFTGGLSAENYIAITGASRATATRDLQDLVEKGALTRRGERRHTRYALRLEEGAE